MNMLETSIVSNANAVSVLRKQSGQTPAVGIDRSANTSDKYIGAAANDAVFAKALTSALSEYMPEKKGDTSGKTSLSSGFDVAITNPEFRTDVVRSNVLNGIKSTIQSFAQSGASADELRFMKDQAIKGIEEGFENASRELSELTGVEYSEKFALAKTSLMESVNQIALSEPVSNQQLTQQNDSLSLELKDKRKADISFGLKKAFDKGFSFNFTTERNSITFSISGDLDENTQEGIVESVNQAERLVDTFFKTDVEQVLASIQRQGLSIKNLMQNEGAVNVEAINPAVKYKQIAGIESSNRIDSRNLAQLKDYAAQLSDTLKAAENVFASQNEYKQLINGLVNQMKDVQVPDILSAINRIHSFNKRLL